MDARRKCNLHLCRADVGTSTIFFVLSLSQERLIDELTDYSLYLSVRRQFSALTVEKKMRHIMRFWGYLQDRAIPLSVLSLFHMRSFRNLELERVVREKSSLKLQMTAKRTVNDKLCSIFSWLEWLKKSKKLPNDIFGGANKGGVASLGEDVGFSLNEIQFRRVGSGSRHKSSYPLDDSHLNSLRILFLGRSSSAYLAERNSIAAEIANSVGLRRASINSLLVGQFDRLQIVGSNKSHFLVRPLSQKFNYEDDFAFPVSLALRICDFIEVHWWPLVRKKKASPQTHLGRLFLSARDARPLTDRALTEIFADRFRSLGMPKGVSIHALRAKFANDCINEEIENRLRRGMDTSSESIAIAVAMRMGHKSVKSLHAYVAVAQSLKGGAMGRMVDIESEGRCDDGL